MLFLVVALHKQRRSDVHRDLYSLHRFLGDDVHIVSTVMVSASVCDMCDVRDMRGMKHRDIKKRRRREELIFLCVSVFCMFDIIMTLRCSAC